MQIQVFGYTNLGDRTENEDSFTYEQLSDTSMYAIVCDGLGGHGGGKRASQLCVNSLAQCRINYDLPTEEQIRYWMNQANSQILEQRENARHMKTTAVALFIQDNHAVWAHIGDSRFYHFHNGELADYSKDHSVCQIAVLQGDITRRDIPSHPDRSKLIKVIGEDSISPEIHPEVVLEPGQHAFLLCSDGLWERLQEDEILLDLHKSATPEQWIYHLRVRAQMRKWSDVDNNTAVVAFVYV